MITATTITKKSYLFFTARLTGCNTRKPKDISPHYSAHTTSILFLKPPLFHENPHINNKVYSL